MKIEEIIPTLGNFGRYQIGMSIYLSLVNTITCLVSLCNVFMAAESDHWCSIFPSENCTEWPEFQDNCTEVKKSMCLPPADGDSAYPYSNCEQYVQPENYTFNPYNPFNTSQVEPCQYGHEYDTSQYHTTIITEFDLVCALKGWPSLAQTMYYGGLLVGSLVFGSLADCVGRKWTTVIASILFVAGSLSTTFSVNIVMFTTMRFIAGFGQVGAYVSLYVLTMEYVGKSWRTPVTMIAGCFYAVGYFVLATVAMYVRDWRNLSLYISVSTLLMLIPLPFMQESVTWLLSKGRVKDAEAVIRKVAKYNKKTLSDGDLFDKDELHKQRELRESTAPPSFIALYRTPNMAVKTINMQYNWLVNSLVYYGLSQSTSDLGVDDYWAFFVSGAVEIPALMYAMFAVERFGRKLNLSILELIGGFACLATIFIPYGIWRTSVAMIGKFCISATYSIAYLYSSELFPTPIRSTGVGMCSVAARVGGILCPYILLLGDTIVFLPLTVFGSSAVLAGTLALFLPETRGQKLPQTLEEGEEFGKCRCMKRAEDETVELATLKTRDPDDGIKSISNPAFEYTTEDIQM